MPAFYEIDTNFPFYLIDRLLTVSINDTYITYFGTDLTDIGTFYGTFSSWCPSKFAAILKKGAKFGFY